MKALYSILRVTMYLFIKKSIISPINRHFSVLKLCVTIWKIKHHDKMFVSFFKASFKTWWSVADARRMAERNGGVAGEEWVAAGRTYSLLFLLILFEKKIEINQNPRSCFNGGEKTQNALQWRIESTSSMKWESSLNSCSPFSIEVHYEFSHLHWSSFEGSGFISIYCRTK